MARRSLAPCTVLRACCVLPSVALFLIVCVHAEEIPKCLFVYRTDFENCCGWGKEAYILWCTNWGFIINIANISVHVEFCITTRQLVELLQNCVDWKQDQLLQSCGWRQNTGLKYTVGLNTQLHICEGKTLQYLVNFPSVHFALLYSV
jgi:hypothetical protein